MSFGEVSKVDHLLAGQGHSCYAIGLVGKRKQVLGQRVAVGAVLGVGVRTVGRKALGHIDWAISGEKDHTLINVLPSSLHCNVNAAHSFPSLSATPHNFSWPYFGLVRVSSRGCRREKRKLFSTIGDLGDRRFCLSWKLNWLSRVNLLILSSRPCRSLLWGKRKLEVFIVLWTRLGWCGHCVFRTSDLNWTRSGGDVFLIIVILRRLGGSESRFSLLYYCRRVIILRPRCFRCLRKRFQLV